MPDRLIITEENQLKEVSIPETPPQPVWIKLLAKIISYVFHPLFIPVYITYFILEVRTYQFAGLDEWVKTLKLLKVIVACTFLPLVTVLLLRALNFIDSVFLKTQKDRIIPYVICMIYYFWNWYTNRNLHEVNDLISISMAIFNASVFGFLANISVKISMHAIAMGVMTTFIALLALNDSVNLSLYLCIAVLISGAVCTSRLIVSDHTKEDLVLGLILGIGTQIFAWWL